MTAHYSDIDVKGEAHKSGNLFPSKDLAVSYIKSDKDTEVSEALSDGAPELPVKGYIDISKYDKRIMASLIEKAEVFERDVLQVAWKHQDEYEKLLKLTS